MQNRTIHPEFFRKKGTLKNITKFLGKFLCQSLFLNKVAAYKETLAWVFSCKYCEIFKSIFFIEHLVWLPLVKLESSLWYQQIFRSSYFWPHWYNGLLLHCNKIVVKCAIHRQSYVEVSIHIHSYHSVICTQPEKFPNIHRMVGALKLFSEWLFSLFITFIKRK